MTVHITAEAAARAEATALLGGFEACTREQQKQLLEFFMYRLGGKKCDLRQEVAAHLPMAYNAWCGSEIVQVTSVKEPERKWS